MRDTLDGQIFNSINFPDYEIEQNQNTNKLEINTNGTNCLTVDENCDIVMTSDLTVNGDLNATLATAAQPNITSIGTLTSLDVGGDINTSTDYNIASTQVLSSTTLGSGVVNSSLTNVGTLTSLTTSGNVGIGVVATDAFLQIGNGTTNDNDRSGVAILSGDSGGATELMGLTLVNTRPTGTNGNAVSIGFAGAGNHSPTVKITAELQGSTDTDLIFSTYNSSLSEKMRIEAGGNVGIGINNPTSLLHIYENNASTSSGLIIENDGTGDSILQFLLTGARRWIVGADNSDNDKFKIASDADLNTNAALTITTGGNVGIGITEPTVPLDVVGDINTSTDYNIGGTQVLSSTTLGSGVVNSSLTSIGTLTSLHLATPTTNGEQAFNVNLNTGSFSGTRWYEIASIPEGGTGNGQIQIEGILAGHSTTNNHGRTIINLLIATRDNFQQMGSVIGDLQNQDLVVYTAASVSRIYLEVTAWVQTNLNIKISSTDGVDTSEPIITYDGTHVTSTPAGVLDFTLSTDVGTNILRQDLSGNVGIGINNPTVPLDVVGDINTTTDYNIGGTQVLSSTTLGTGVVNSSLTSIGTLTSLTTSGDIISTAGEVQTFSCQTIGALGYILVDSVSTTALSNSTFAFTAKFNELGGSQSLDPFAFYTMIIRGDHDGNGNVPHIDYRFYDNTGEISDSLAYQNTITAFNGGVVVSNRDSNGELVFANGNSLLVNHYFGEFRIALGSPTNPQNTYISGQYTSQVGNGTGLLTANVGNSLTNLAIIDTKIESIGFRAQNVNTGANRNLQVRIYRLM